MKEFLDNQYKNLFLWTPIFAAFGMGLYFSLGTEPSLWILLLALILGISMFFGVKKWPILCLFACFFTGFGYSGIYTHTKNVKYIEHDVHGIEITGKITDVDFANEKMRIYLDTEKYGTVRVSTTTNESYKIGDVISGNGGLFKPGPADIPNGFDFARWAYFDNISATGYIQDIKTIYTTKSAVYNIRNTIKKHANSFLADSLILGYKHTLPDSHRGIWATNGMSHIWSISGYHTTLVMGWLFILFYFLFRLFPKLVKRTPARIPAILCAWCGLIGYVLLSGCGVATLRAFLMATLIMLAFILRRNIISLRIASIAFIILIMINPHFVMQAGFQLSFAAIFGILWLWTVVNPTLPNNKFLKYIYGAFLTALIATLFTCPFAIMHFGTLSLYGILGNLIFLPVFSFIIMPLVIIGTILSIFGLLGPLVLAHNVYNIMLTIASDITSLPLANLNVGYITNIPIIFITLGFCCIIFIRNSDKFKYAILRHFNLLLGGTLISIGTIIFLFSPLPVFYISNNHKLIGAVIDGKLHFNKTHDSSNYFAFDTWKQSNCETQGTDNLQLHKEYGVYKVNFPHWSIVHIQNFTTLSKNILSMCNDDGIKYIVSYFNVNTDSKCARKIIHGGGIIYKSGHFTKINSNRFWHNRHE
ncbi:MAG: ComEC family competence protein [Alphaproteobacteria bacterium]|nr:ComEC family competence protein [Alphaproteobacteria bacterium]